jgi:uncharacterized protein YxjI
MARYTMRQRLVSIGEDFDIADEYGNPVFRVDGKVMRLRDTFVPEDLQGRKWRPYARRSSPCARA